MEKAAENPQVVFQPISCMHCNHAPCETVCPVAATSHGRQGQNQMAYNRCVGTRYCANNCPYKVRRFNWFTYADNDEFDYNMNNPLGKMALNPDVNVRSRGVMEKCSLCIQMTQKVILDAKRDGRKVKDGEFQTACSQACSDGAMVFGDVNDKESEISVHALEASPVRMPSHMDLHCIPFSRFVDAVDAWKGGHDAGALERRQSESIEMIGGRQPSTETETLQRRLDQQKKTLEGFAEKVHKQQELGHAIQNNWTHVQDLLKQVNDAVSSQGWDVTKKQFKEIPWVESGNAAEGSIVAVLPDENGVLSETKVTLFLELTVHQNAQIYFESANKHKDKSKGGKAAMVETEELLTRAHKKETKRKASGQVARVKRTKRLWFENHRWTIIDGMHLMVGGRDAKGNDSIVKKHLKADDRYVHADLHGAPSCAMKLQQGFIIDPNPPQNLPSGVPSFLLSDNIEVPNFSDEACEQAATMALCWSRGWSGGGGAGTAFWVKPGQVSKQAETGEYVARGAFVVRGQRNWYKDLQLKMGLGLICINGIPLLLAGTTGQVSSLCDRWIELIPGRIKREQIASRLRKSTGLMIDDIVPIIPGLSELGLDHGLLEYLNEEE